MSLNMRLIAVLFELVIALLPIACGLEALAFSDDQAIDDAVLGRTVDPSTLADGAQGDSISPLFIEPRFRNANITFNASESETGVVLKSPFISDILDRSTWFIRPSDPQSIRECCQDCLSFPCADEQCRRQISHHCNVKCNSSVIGGCNCPPGRTVCEGLCCKPGEVCTLDGCSPPNEVCNNRHCLGKCLPDGCCPLGHIVCNNRCCELGIRACASDGNCVGCGGEGQIPCAKMTCKGDLHLNIDMLSNRLICTASCGHSHQPACRTTYPVPGGVRSRYRCFSHSMLSATGPANPSNCICVPNTINDRENDVSDNSGFCISTFPAPGDIADPPDCDEPGCS